MYRRGYNGNFDQCGPNEQAGQFYDNYTDRSGPISDNGYKFCPMTGRRLYQGYFKKEPSVSSMSYGLGHDNRGTFARRNLQENTYNNPANTNTIPTIIFSKKKKSYFDHEQLLFFCTCLH